MNWELYGLFLLTGFLAAGAPGPSIAFTVSQSVRYGAKRAFPSVLGLMLASIVYGIATLAGVGAVFIVVPEISIAVRLLGACYLAYLGYQQLTCVAEGFTGNNTEDQKVARQTFVDGFLIGLANPKIMLFYMMFIPQFVDPSRPVVWQISVLVLSQYIIKASVLLFYVATANLLRSWLGTKKRVAILNKIIGIVLVGVALALAVSASFDLIGYRHGGLIFQ